MLIKNLLGAFQKDWFSFWNYNGGSHYIDSARLIKVFKDIERKKK